MTDLRKLARNRECQIRVPGYCSGDPATVVLCHYRMPGMSGAGFKSPDWLGAYGCYACHAVVDRQTRTGFEVTECNLMLAEAVFRTLAILEREGIRLWGPPMRKMSNLTDWC